MQGEFKMAGKHADIEAEQLKTGSIFPTQTELITPFISICLTTESIPKLSNLKENSILLLKENRHNPLFFGPFRGFC